jgi:hypothetical protein
MSRELCDFEVLVTEGDEPHEKAVVVSRRDTPDPYDRYKKLWVVRRDDYYDFRVRIIVHPNDNYDMWVKVMNPETLPEKYNPEPTIYYHPEASWMDVGQKCVVKHRGEWYETQFGIGVAPYLGSRLGLKGVPDSEARNVQLPAQLLL